MKPVDFGAERAWAVAHEQDYLDGKLEITEKKRIVGFLAYLDGQHKAWKRAPPVDQRLPPSPAVRDLYERGHLPFDAFDDGRLDVCGCSHVIGAHRHGLFGCEAKRCPCPAYQRDARYVLPPWGSKRADPVKA